MDPHSTYPWPPGLTPSPSRPCLVGTISSPEGLKAIQHTVPTDCDVIELRHDLIQRPIETIFETATQLRQKGKGVIFTARLTLEGGQWEKDSPDRYNLLVNALNYVNMVDIESASLFASEFIKQAEDSSAQIILSSHDFSSTPSLSELKKRCRMDDHRKHVIHKVATHLQSEEDLRVLKQLITERGGAVGVRDGHGVAGASVQN